jgi:hypothetical protein
VPVVRTTGVNDHSDTAIRWKLTIGGSDVIWTSEAYQMTDGQAHATGPMPLPPWTLAGTSDPWDLVLVAEGRVTTAGSTGYFDADFIALMPTEGLRRLAARIDTATLLAYPSTILDDMIEGLVTVTRSGDELGTYGATGTGLAVVPGTDYGLTLLLVDGDDDVDVARTATVRAWYRPRRSTVES